jgi:hypothetical protein
MIIRFARICACFFILVMARVPELFAVDCSQFGGCKMCDNQLRCLSTTSWGEIKSGVEWGVDLSCNDGVVRRVSCAAGGVVNGTMILRNFYNCYENGKLVKTLDTGVTGGCSSSSNPAKAMCENYYKMSWSTGPFSCRTGSAISDNVTVAGSTESCPSGYFAVNTSVCPLIEGAQIDDVGTKAMVCE